MSTGLKLRPGTPNDAEACGKICYEAFTTLSRAHNFTPDFPSEKIAIGLIESLLSHPGFYSVVAELDGRIVGSNFLDERSAIAGLGPITVDSSAQNRSVGRQLLVARCEVRPRRTSTHAIAFAKKFTDTIEAAS